MNLRWNPAYRRFEAEFSDFQGDLAAVKAAGFKTTGPPEWIWYALNTVPLGKLRENRPASGLTINSDAKAEYTRLAEIDAKNAEVRAEVAKHKKAQKKVHDKQKREGELHTVVIPSKGYIGAEDLPAIPSLEIRKPLTWTGPRCIICGDPVSEWEYREGAPPICLWDQKIVLDNVDQVC